MTRGPASGRGPRLSWQGRPLEWRTIVLLTIAVGIVLRLIMAGVLFPGSGLRNDIGSFGGWAIRMATLGPGGFYGAGFADYPPGYMYVLWGLGEIGQFLKPFLNGLDITTGLVKIPGIFADAGVAWMLFIYARRFAGAESGDLAGQRLGAIAAALFMLNPGPIFNSAIWGQMDSVGTLVILGGLYALARGWTEAASLAAVVALLIKFQFGWLIPIVMVVGLKRHILGRSADPARAGRSDPVRVLSSLAVGVGSMVLLILPFGLTIWSPGAPDTTLVGRFIKAAQTYEGVTVNAMNLWRNPWSGAGEVQSWGGSDQGIAFVIGDLSVTWQMCGILLFAVVALLALVHVARRDTPTGLIVGSLMLATAFFALPTRVHERYLFPAVALASLLVARGRGWVVLFVALSSVFFLNIYWVFSYDWLGSYGPPPTNAIRTGEPLIRDPFLAATILSQWGVWILSQVTTVAVIWLVVQATWMQVRESDDLIPMSAGAALTPMPIVAAPTPAEGGPPSTPGPPLDRSPTWLREDPDSPYYREPMRRLDRRDALALVLIVLVAFGFRVWRLDLPRSMHFDEQYHARTAVEIIANERWGWNRDWYEWTHPMLAKYLIAAGITFVDPNQVERTTTLDRPFSAMAVAPERAARQRVGSVVFVGDASGRIEARAADSGELLSSWDAGGPIASLAFDPDTPRLLVGFANSGDVGSWDLTVFLATAGPRGPPPALPAIPTVLPDVQQIAIPNGASVLLLRGSSGIALLEIVTGVELAHTDLAAAGVAYVPAGTSESEPGSKVIAVDTARGVVAWLNGDTLLEQTAQTPLAPPAGPVLVRGSGTSTEIWVPIGALLATDEYPDVDGGLAIYTTALSVKATVPLPGAPLAIGWDRVANLVYVAGADRVWTVETHGDSRAGFAAYDETTVPAGVVGLDFDTSDDSQTEDHARLMVLGATADGGSLTAVDIRQNAFSWRFAGIVFGAGLAGLVYLLAASLFRRRRVAVLAAVFVAVDGMSFVMSRIAMNDIFVAFFIVLAYLLFWQTWGGRWARSAWWVIPLVGVAIGLAAATKWVGWYALVGLWVLTMSRSQLGRFVLVAAVGFLAVVAGFGAPWPFLVIMFGALAVALVVAWVKPIRLKGADLWAVPASALVGGVVLGCFALAWSSVEGREPSSLIEVGIDFVFRGIQAGWPAAVALIVAGTLLLARTIRSFQRPESDAAWYEPGEMAGFAWPWLFSAMFVVPFAVYVLTYIPWLQLGHSIAIPSTGPGYHWSLDELHAQMFGYHFGLQAGHAASSPWWSWPLDLKTVWFYSHSFDNSLIAVIYNGGNPALFWASVPAVAMAGILAWRRRSWALLLVMVAFSFQFLPWARVERAVFQYHYLTAVIFAFIAIAYFVDEALRDWEWRDFAVAYLVAGAVLGLLIYPIGSALAMPDWYINAFRALPPWNYAFQFPPPPQGERPPLLSGDMLVLAVGTVVSLAAAAFALMGRDWISPEPATSAGTAEGGQQDDQPDHDQPDRPQPVETDFGKDLADEEPRPEEDQQGTDHQPR
jgi:Gpi18-like mannosyltransferase